jgi:hypothetical protein
MPIPLRSRSSGVPNDLRLCSWPYPGSRAAHSGAARMVKVERSCSSVMLDDVVLLVCLRVSRVIGWWFGEMLRTR